MTAALATLNPAAQVALVSCEQRIERGLKTFIDVGQALAEIRDSRLYKGTHGTFEDYCRDRWKMSDGRARQFMIAAETATNVAVEGLPAPTNEGQARALAAVPEPERAEVWRETVERTNGKPTAAAVRAVQTERTQTPGPADAAISPPVDPGTTVPDITPPAGSPATWTAEQHDANQREIDRKRMVAAGQRAAQSLVMSVRAEISTVVSAVDLGEKNLINPQMIADLRRAVDLLESRLEASK